MMISIRATNKLCLRKSSKDVRFRYFSLRRHYPEQVMRVILSLPFLHERESTPKALVPKIGFFVIPSNGCLCNCQLLGYAASNFQKGCLCRIVFVHHHGESVIA